jgi:hypothetical protein
MITNCIAIPKPPEELCPELVLNLEPTEADGTGLAQSVLTTYSNYLPKNLVFLLFLLLIILLFTPFISLAGENNPPSPPFNKGGMGGFSGDLKEVVVEGLAIIGADTTKSEARIMALNDARRNAIEEASGVYVKGSTLVSDYRIIFDLINASSKGVIVKEEILDEDKRLIKDKTPEGKVVLHETHTIKLKAIVKPLNPNRGIKITKLTLHKAGRDEPLNMPVFINNEEAQIRLRVNKDSYIHIFSIAQDGVVTKLLPDQYFPPLFIKQGEEVIFPKEEQRNMGLRLKVTTPQGFKKALESIVIIATKDNYEFLKDIKQPTIIDLWKELSEIDSSAWGEDMVGYEVRR